MYTLGRERGYTIALCVLPMWVETGWDGKDRMVHVCATSRVDKSKQQHIQQHERLVWGANGVVAI